MAEQRIVALSIDKVQTFLTEAIHSHVQEKQAEKATLKKIKRASREIANGFASTVKDFFNVDDQQVLLACSGVCVFRSDLSEQAVRDKINTLFLEYYHASQGQKLLRGVTFPENNMKPIKAIQQAKKELKESNCISRLIQDNRETLFTFQKVLAENVTEEKDEPQPMFAETINALYRNREEEKNEAGKKEEDKRKTVLNNENHFRIAVIKADLDGMGEIFRKEEYFDTYRDISEVLNRGISLQGLHKAAENCGMAPKEGWIFPFYIAGDDIFFAVEATDLINGINVCRELLRQINSELPAGKKLSLSIGVEITFNREPIRYYMERVEVQLRQAKAANKLALLQGYSYGKIAIFGAVYYDVDYTAAKRKKEELKKKSDKSLAAFSDELKDTPVWEFMLRDIRLLQEIRSTDQCKKLIGTNNFFYSLLERLHGENVRSNNIKYANYLLYHLMPRFLDSPDQKQREYELLLNARIIQRLYRKVQDESADKSTYRFVLDTNTKQRFEAYLRLLLLCCDARFDLKAENQEAESMTFRDSVSYVRKFLMNKPTDYLYHSLRPIELRDIFARSCSLGEKKASGYQRLNLQSSMLIRMRDVKWVSITKAANMIELHNPFDNKTKDLIEKQNDERTQKDKIPYHLFFEKEKFIGQVRAWTTDFIDSLMLFYAYNEATIQFKHLYPRKK